jgi:hypothetical protein
MPGRPQYQDRPDQIADKAWNRGYIEAFELARIVAWKNAINVASITVNTPREIEACTRTAMSVIERWRGQKATALATDIDWADWQSTANAAIGWVGKHREPSSGLLSLTGVGYPVATAILDILDPNVWPVIDKWAAKTVFGIEIVRYTAAIYARYARHLATEGTRHWGAGLSIHELDLRAQSASMKGGSLPAGWRRADPRAPLEPSGCLPEPGLVADFERTLGDMRPDTLGSRDNLAAAYQDRAAGRNRRLAEPQ